ncbi:hypothetical protein ACWEOE_10770 [Amycolatopsis sp. NPDC004368]
MSDQTSPRERTAIDPGPSAWELLGCVADETPDETTSTAPMPAEDGDASERPNQPGETASARAALNATIGSLAAGMAEAGKNLRRNLEAVGLVSASERPNAGQEDATLTDEITNLLVEFDEVDSPSITAAEIVNRIVAPALEFWRRLELEANAREVRNGLAANAAEQRAASWWEAAKYLRRVTHRQLRLIDEANSRADAAEAKLEEWTLMENDQARRAQAAEAELAETNRLLTAYQHDVVAWKRERDEALAKLDEIRDAVAEVLVDAGDHYQDNDDCIEGCPACALANVRKIVNPGATRG